MTKAGNFSCYLSGVIDGAMWCYSGVYCVLGGFPRATIRVTAMNRNACMENSVAQVTLRESSA